MPHRHMQGSYVQLGTAQTAYMGGNEEGLVCAVLWSHACKQLGSLLRQCATVTD